MNKAKMYTVINGLIHEIEWCLACCWDGRDEGITRERPWAAGEGRIERSELTAKCWA